MNAISRHIALVCLFLVAACGAKTQTGGEIPTHPAYPAVQDEDFLVPAVEARDVPAGYERQDVAYSGDEKPGTIVVDTFARRLYHVQENGMATRYAIAVGREGLSFRGSGVIGRKEKWPFWQPTANMIRTRPDLYAEYAAGMEGGLDNPLGARAMYLYRGGKDSKFRIHGSIQNEAIGRATSAGCIRLYNQDAIYLFDQVELGTRVKVRSKEESLEMEGPFIEDAWGRAVIDTPETRARKEVQLVERARQELAEAETRLKTAIEARKAAEKADKKRLSACRRQGLDEAACPPLPEPVLAEGETAPEPPPSVEEAEKAVEAARANLDAATAEAARLAACSKDGVAHEECPAAPPAAEDLRRG